MTDVQNKLSVEELRHVRPLTVGPPPVLETGSIITVRMRGHSRSNGEEYFAPAMVLQQYQPNGEVDLAVFDHTAGVSLMPGYRIREIGSRGDGDRREEYVAQNNIDRVIFSPALMDEMLEENMQLRSRIVRLELQIEQLVDQLTDGTAAPATGLQANQVGDAGIDTPTPKGSSRKSSGA